MAFSLKDKSKIKPQIKIISLSRFAFEEFANSPPEDKEEPMEIRGPGMTP